MKNVIPLLLGLIYFQVNGQGTPSYDFPPYVVNPPEYGIAWSVNNLTWPWKVGNELVHEGTNSFEVHQNANVEFVSANKIRISGPFRATGLTTNGRFHAHIEPDLFEVKLITPLTNGAVGKHEKVEFGIIPPQEVLDGINIFLDYNDLPFGQYQLNGWQQLGGINPFLEWEIRVHALVRTVDASNQTLLQERTIEAFYYRDFQPTSIGEIHWTPTTSQIYPFRLRFTPDMEGQAYVKFFIERPNQQTLETQFYRLNVDDLGTPGYVTVGQSGRFLKRDGGTFFPVGRNHSGPTCFNCENGIGYPNGMTFGPYSRKVFPPEAYHNFLADMEAHHNNGSRYFRLMSHPYTLEIEYERLGNYTDRLHIAHEIDKIFEQAEALDMMIHWNLQYHSSLSKTAPYYMNKWDWTKQNACDYVPPLESDPGYCYSSDLGLLEPIDFLTNQTALQYYEQRLRYIFSRWGYSTNFAVAEFMNEADNFGADFSYDEPTNGCTYDEYQKYNPYTGKIRSGPNGVNSSSVTPKGAEIGNWLKRMAEYVRSPDKLDQRQLIAVNYTGGSSFIDNIDPASGVLRNEFGDDAISSPFVDMLSFHSYSNDPNRFYNTTNGIRVIHQNMMAKLGKHKPIMFSEGGVGDDNLECGLTNGRDVGWIRTLMASAFTGAAGAAMPWDYQFDRGDPTTWGSQLSVYQSYLSMYMNGIDLDGQNWKPFNSERADKRAEMLYLVRGDGTQATGFIGNRTYNFYTAAQENNLTGTSCYDFDDEVEWTSDNGMIVYRNPTSISADISGAQAQLVLALNANANYQTAFYDAFYPVDQPSAPMFGPIPTSTDANPSFIMPHPDLEIPDYPDDDTPFILFRTEQTGNPFKVENNDLTATVVTRQQLGLQMSQTEVVETEPMVNSVTDNLNTSLSIYPNPIKDNEILHVDLIGTGEDTSYELFDSAGKVLMQGKFRSNKNRLDLGRFAQGVYSLRLSFSGSVENRLIIKQ